MTFKWGSTACENIAHWKRAVDLIEAKAHLPFKDTDKHCKYLREKAVVYGVLVKERYKDTNFAKVKASDGKSYWVELPAVLPIITESSQQPVNWKTDLRELK